jgi:N6-adenosine-specific RNA methylase IME4
MEDLGYKLHARMIWNKITGIPAAFTIRYGHEYLLYMYRGKLIPVALNERGKIHSVFTEQVTTHSRKPEISYQIIERLYPNLTKLEMYARTKRNNWDSWGNEINSDIILKNTNYIEQERTNEDCPFCGKVLIKEEVIAENTNDKNNSSV